MRTTRKIQIKDLKVGMKIKTKDESGDVIFKQVTDKWNTIVKFEDQVQLKFENKVVLNCSINHPIMVVSDSGTFLQKKPLDISREDSVLTETGFTRLEVVNQEQNNDENYIDITVEDTHMFFASASEHGQMVLTHNSQGGIRNACVSIDSYVDVLEGFEFNSVEYYHGQHIIVNGKEIHITSVLTTLAYMGDDNERETYLQNLFS